MAAEPPALRGSWTPGDREALLLQACFAAREDTRLGAWTRWKRGATLDALDRSSLELLASLFIQRPDRAPDDQFIALGRQVYFDTLRRNLQREAGAATAIAALQNAGIDTLLLKGAAVNASVHASRGVRDMSDVDVLVRAAQVGRAVETLSAAGWQIDNGGSASVIVKESRVHHAWSLSRSGDDHLDLHWRPIASRADPAVTEAFWARAKPAAIGGAPTRVPDPADLLLLTCTHAIQLAWHASCRWIVDAMAMMSSERETIDWNRLIELSRCAHLTVRLHVALSYLREALGAPVPDAAVDALRASRTPRWEHREAMLQTAKPPLRRLQSLEWHLQHFGRLRPFDARWRALPAPLAFLDYVRAWSDTRTAERPASFLTRRGSARSPSSTFGTD
jgi:hypothetical protein